MGGGSPTRRVDAERNRQRIVDAARQAFAEPGAEVSMAEVARLSGVGSATLYRNFPSRRALLEALYTDDIDVVCAAAEDGGADGAGPDERLVRWLERFYGYFTGKQLVARELLRHTDESAPVFGAGRGRILAAGRPLLASAQATRQVRPDLTIEQVIDLVAAVGNIPGGEAYRRPILTAALAALTLVRVSEGKA